MVDDEQLPAAPDVVYPAVLDTILELMRLANPDNPWRDTLKGDLELFRDNRQVTPTLFYNNMGTLPDEGVRARPGQQVWVDAAFRALLWLGQVAGKRIGPPRELGFDVPVAFGSASICMSCKREYIARGWLEYMAATAWAREAVPRLLVEAGPGTSALRILGAVDLPECRALQVRIEQLITDQGVEITEYNPISWPRLKCPACGGVTGTRTWRLEGSPPKLVVGEQEE